MRFFNVSRLLLVGFFAVTASGCATNALTEGISRAFALNGATLASEYKNANLVGIVGVDELPASQYHRVVSNYLHVAGAQPNTPERHYRIVPIVIRESDNFRHTLVTGAYVPDHMPLLRQNDIVEFRNLEVFDNLRNFVKTGDGNVVLNVICFKADPQYDECTKTKAPWKGKGKTATVSGVAGTAWKPVESYGFIFTPRYDDEGNTLPGAPAIPPAPFLSPTATR